LLNIEFQLDLLTYHHQHRLPPPSTTNGWQTTNEGHAKYVVAGCIANCSQIDLRWVFCRTNLTPPSQLMFFLFSTGKAPCKQLATKAAKKTAQVWLLVTVTAVNSVALTIFS
jgi:hypothetical protein